MLHRRRITAISTCLLFLCLLLYPAHFARASGASSAGLSAKLMPAKQRIVLISHGVTYTLAIHKNWKNFLSVSGWEPTFLTIRDAGNNHYYAPRELLKAKVVHRNDKRIVVEAEYEVEPVKEDKTVGCRVMLTLTIARDWPGLAIQTKLINSSMPTFRCQPFWGWMHGESYTPAAMKPAKWSGSYGYLPPTMRWVYLSLYPKAHQSQGRGVVTTGQFEQTPFHSMLAASDPATRMFHPGDTILWSMVIFPAKNARAVQAAYQALPQSYRTTTHHKNTPIVSMGHPGPQSSYYQTKKILLGYPAIPLRPNRAPDSTFDSQQNFRMTLEAFDHLTPAKADAIAKKAASHGFTWIIGEHNRYLFYRPGEKLPLPNHSYPKTMDQLIHDGKLMTQACHRYGMKYALHQTCTMVTKDFLDHHPSMAAIDLRTGKPITTGYGTYAASIADPAFGQLYLKRLTRLIQGVHPDGLMQDEIAFWKHTAGGSQAARQAFTDATGLALPAHPSSQFFTDRSNPIYQRWMQWRKQVIERFNAKVTAICHRHDVVRFNYNSTQTEIYYIHRRTGAVLPDVASYADMLGYECEPPGFRTAGYLYTWPNVICEMKLLRATATAANTPGAPWVLFYPKRVSDYTWNWLEARSEGLRLWWRSGNAKMVPAWQPLVNWERNHEGLLENVQPVAHIGVVLSLDTAEHNTVKAARDYLCGFTSLCGALTDSHLPYRVLLPSELTPSRLKALGVHTIMLMGADHLSDAHAAAIRAFVKAGGVLIASGRTSLDKPFGKPHSDFALSDVFGVSYVGPRDSQKNTLHISRNVLHLAATTLHGDQNYVRVKPTTATTVGTMTDAAGQASPGVTVNRYGKGRVLYFAGHPERKYFLTFYTRDKMYSGKPWTDHRSDKFRLLLAAAAQFGDQTPVMIASNLPKGVVVEMRSQDYRGFDNIQVHLTNFMGGEIHAGRIPMSPSYTFADVAAHRPDLSKPITVAVHTRRPVKHVYVVSPDFQSVVALKYTLENGYTRVVVPNVYRYEILCFTFNDGAKIRRMAGGRVTDTWPAPVPLRDNIHRPLVGSYDPHAVVIFAGAPALHGGRYLGTLHGRSGQVIYGSKSKYPAITADFLWPQADSPASLELGAMDAGAELSATFQILINGKVVVNQTSALPGSDWGVYHFSVPAGILKHGKNKITIRSTAPSSNNLWPPWLAVNFIKVTRR